MHDDSRRELLGGRVSSASASLDTLVDRRSFLQQAAAVATLSLGATTLGCAGTQTEGAPKAKSFKLSLAQWSFHRRLRGRQAPALTAKDFPKEAKALGFDGVEYVNQFFVDKVTDRAWLGDLKKRTDDLGIRNVLIMCDGLGALGDASDKRREAAIVRHLPWLDAAAFLGCHSIRVNARSSGSREQQLALAADGLRKLTEHGASRGLNVLVENHGGWSSNGAWLAEVMRKVDHPRCGTLPDFGNFRLGQGKNYDRYKGVSELMPYAKAVSAKSYDFDARGDETTIDYWRMMKIVRGAGYDSYVGVEYEGDRLSEIEGVKRTRDLLKRIRANS